MFNHGFTIIILALFAYSCSESPETDFSNPFNPQHFDEDYDHDGISNKDDTNPFGTIIPAKNLVIESGHMIQDQRYHNNSDVIFKWELAGGEDEITQSVFIYESKDCKGDYERFDEVTYPYFKYGG